MAFAKEWLIPKLGVAIAVFALGSVLFSMDKSIEMTTEAVDRFEKLFKLTGSVYYEWILIVTAIVWLTSLCCKVYTHFRKPNWKVFWLGRKARIIATGLLMVFGFLATPLAIAFTFAYVVTGVGFAMKLNVMTYAIVYIILSATLHFMSFDDAHPLHSITYVLSVDRGVKGDLLEATIKSVSDCALQIKWLERPKLLVESADGQVVLCIPVQQKESHWSKDQIKTLKGALRSIDGYWQSAGLQFQRTMSPDLAHLVK